MYAPTLTADQYVRGILQQRSRNVSEQILKKALDQVVPHVKTWANRFLLNLSLSGSYAKKTAIGSGSDIDLFISLSPDTPETLAEIYQTLFNTMQGAGLNPRKQNVSIGLNVGGVKIDLVPGKQQKPNAHDHSLYLRKADSWRKTNIQQHISYITASGCIEEIRAIKCWRDCQQLEFPTFNIELAVIKALQGKSQGQLASNVMAVFNYLSKDFVAATLVDPANTNNIVSGDMTLAEKKAVAQAGTNALQATNWNQILW